MYMPRSDFHILHAKRRCYNQKCINKSEDGANTASKRSDTDLGPALRQKGLSAKKSFHLRDERGEERCGEGSGCHVSQLEGGSNRDG